MKITITHLEVINNCVDLFDICNTTNHPVFITKDGKSDLVALSISEYMRLNQLNKDK